MFLCLEELRIVDFLAPGYVQRTAYVVLAPFALIETSENSKIPEQACMRFHHPPLLQACKDGTGLSGLTLTHISALWTAGYFVITWAVSEVQRTSRNYTVNTLYSAHFIGTCTTTAPYGHRTATCRSRIFSDAAAVCAYSVRYIHRYVQRTLVCNWISLSVRSSSERSTLYLVSTCVRGNYRVGSRRRFHQESPAIIIHGGCHPLPSSR